jgi:hypothetical protein
MKNIDKFLIALGILLIFFLLIVVYNVAIKENDKENENACKKAGFVSYERLNNFDLCLDSDGYYSIVKLVTSNNSIFEEDVKVISKFNMDLRK